MAGIDAYASCPCGSGQKYKWCCQKVEATVDRAMRLYETGAPEAAVEAIDEGIKKDGDVPLLLTRKALLLARLGKPYEAKHALETILLKQPKHAGARMLLTRITLEIEGPQAGVAQLQEALAHAPEGGAKALSPLIRLVGGILGEMGFAPSARAHLELVERLGNDAEGSTAQAIRTLDRAPGLMPWLKQPYRLSPAPEDLDPATRADFDAALSLSNEGRWSAAATAFDLLTGSPAARVLAERNLGLCRLFLADDRGAVEALRRYAGTLGPVVEAVEIEALCQQIAPAGPEQLVERVQKIWTLRDRAKLLANLRALGDVMDEGRGPANPDDEDSPEVDQFALMDMVGANLETIDSATVDQIPTVIGRVLVGQEIAILETYDDGRLDALVDRFMGLAGTSIPPAHPKTKPIGKVDRASLALTWEWVLPEGTPPPAAERLHAEKRTRMIRESWPKTNQAYLGGRTPEAAAKAGDAEIPLRAALLAFEIQRGLGDQTDLIAVRDALKVPSEPEVDPATVNIDTLPIVRFHRVPAEQLSDDKLVAFYRQSRKFMIATAMERASRALVDRPQTWGNAGSGISSIALFADLASLAANAGRLPEAFDWITKGRQADTPVTKAINAPVWDMLEVRFKARGEAPEVWVPELAVVLDRYRENQAASQAILLNLVEMGLVQVQPNPDRPDDLLLDSRPLQALLTRYGPKVTTASGRLGVSATKGDLWTPGSQGGGAGGGLWTPGSPQGGKPAEKPKLIIPGR